MSDMRGIAGPNHKDRRGTSELARRQSGCDRGRNRTELLRQQVGVPGEHPRPAHGATASDREFSHVHRPGHVGVAMTEKEGNLVNALAGQQSSACDGVPEAMHRRKFAVRDR